MSLTNEPGWQPDPFGRHELRWWDGTTWSDQVSDGGATSTDPPGEGGATGSETVALGSIPPAQPPGSPIGGSPPTATPGAPFGAPGAPPGTPPGAPIGVGGTPPGAPGAPPTGGGGGGGGATVAIVIGVIVVVALIAGAVLFFVVGGGGGGDGTGEFSATLEDDQLDFYQVDLAGCEAMIAELDDPDGFDAVLGVASGELDEDFFDDDDIDLLEDSIDGFFTEGDAEDLIEEEGLVAGWNYADSGFEDEGEEVGMVAPYDLTVTVIVGSFDGDGGDYELTIETEDPPEGSDCDFDDADDAEDFFSDESEFYSDFLS